MEKKMERMKNEIVGQNKFYGAIAALGIAMIGMMSSGMIDNAYSLNEHSGDFMHGFVMGIVLVMEFYAVFGIGKNLKALKDEKKLTRLYNELHDERSEQIEAISSKTGMQIAMILTLAAAIIISPYSFEAFLAMLGAIVIAGITRKCCKMYYFRNYTGKEE